ncbi:MAG: DEAD/DEAH box helicase, partial [Firmicutes bacterium]|nr:DEAD/DEAH box helicase [Bacillota bacterium]
MPSALALFDAPTAAWFTGHIGTPTAVQEEGWPAIAQGGHVLISAPTGTGKTLSAFLVFIDRLKAMAARGELKQALYLIYISPLKALGNDIRENLRRPLEGIAGPELAVAVRTGDTTQAERQRMLRHPPHILITTPESLYLLLTSRGGQGLLNSARAIILDELHALINSKRGAHLMLSLARLDRLCEKPLQRIGLSATIEPLDEAGQYLAAPDPVTIIAPKMRKSMDIQVTSPLADMRTLPEGTIWPELARSVYERCEGCRTVIVFVEGRAQAEKLAHGINELGGQGFARTHHGCVSKEQRLLAERQLRSGELRVMCATSSMELGIDVGEVDLVMQIGFPATISSTMQRLGRAGHNPGRTSIMHLFPRMALEGVYCGLTATVAMEGGIEHSKPPRKCLDVVAQHLVSMAASAMYSVEDAMDTLSRAHCLRDVTRGDVENVLRMLAGDYEHQADQPSRPRLLYDRIHGTIMGDTYSRMLALSAGGTIPDRGFFAVRLKDGTKLGEVDEVFAFEARVGDKFLLGSFAWRIVELRSESIMVEPSSPEGAQSPFWLGDWAGRPYQTGLRFGELLRGLTEAHAGRRLYEALRDLRL